MQRISISHFIATLGIVTFAANSVAQTLTAPPAPEQGLMPSSQLAAVIDKAVTTNPDVRAHYQDFVSSLEGQNVARGEWRPQVTAQAWTGKEWGDNVSNTPSHNWRRHGWNLELRQLVFDGGIASNNIKQLGFEKLSGFYKLQATTDNLANQIVQAYLDIQRYRQRQALAKDNYTLHANTLKLLSDRRMSGVGRGVDLEQANGRLALAQSNLMTETNNLNDVTQRYRRLTGEYPQGDLAPVPDVNSYLPTLDTASNFIDSLRQNPSLLSKQALVQAAQAGNNSAKGLHAPKLEFRGGTGRDRNSPFGDERDQQSSYVKLIMTYNLYRGGADAARVRQTTAQANAARDVADYTCRNIQQELSVAWNNMQLRRQQLPFLREHAQATSKARLAYQQQFQIGERSLLDLLDTENELFDARLALLDAQFDLKKYEYQWLTMSGRLLQALELAQPQAKHQPEEQQAFVVPDDMLQACMTPVSDVANLAPVVQYRDGDQPPLLKLN